MRKSPVLWLCGHPSQQTVVVGKGGLLHGATGDLDLSNQQFIHPALECHALVTRQFLLLI